MTMFEETAENEKLQISGDFIIDTKYKSAMSIECSMISTNKSNTTPFRKQTFPFKYAYSLKFGSVINLSEDGRFTEQHDFYDHRYDYVVVLEKNNYNLVLFGNKIGKCSIDTRESTGTIVNAERGDKLLFDTYYNRILHNVTSAQMIYDMQKMLTR